MNNELSERQVEEILLQFRNIQQLFRRRFEKIAKQYGLTSPQLAVVVHIYEIPSITLQELTNHMMLTKSTVSGIVDRLTKQGVVIRKIPEDNRRIVNLSISEDFKKNNDIGNVKKKLLSELMSNSNPEDVEKIICGLNQFRLLLKDIDSE